jgi:ubiquitin-activating enzyme E1
MWFLRAPAAVAGLVTVALLPTVASKPLAVLVDELNDYQNEPLLAKRQCAEANICGWERTLCCENGQSCSTNAVGQAVCVAGAGADSTGGSWQFSTAVVTQTGVITQTSVYSTFIPAATGGVCSASGDCAAGYYCTGEGTCKPIAGPTPGVTPGIVNPSAPLRPTSSGLIIVTATGSPTATLPFSTPIPTGANGTLVESNSGGGGLSGGAIAGIVIGVILGIILLLLICFYCCAKSAFSAILAIFGLGKKRKTREETTYIEEHHHSGSAAAGGGRRWYGQGGSSRPSRPPKKSGGGLGGLLGVGAGLAGLAAVLGMKRKNDRRHDDKSTTVSGSSYYSYGDYTSSSK